MLQERSELAGLFAGDDDTQPAYRFHLAYALCEECHPWCIADLFAHVYPGVALPDVPQRACDMLIAAFQQWEDRI